MIESATNEGRQGLDTYKTGREGRNRACMRACKRIRRRPAGGRGCRRHLRAASGTHPQRQGSNVDFKITAGQQTADQQTCLLTKLSA